MSGFFSRFAPFVLLASASPLCGQQVLLPIDISPDDPSNYTFSPGSGNNAAGRIKEIVVDPKDPTVVYAAAEYAGIWKSTTGAVWEGSGGNGHSTAGQMKWSQASTGLLSGLTAGGTSLAIDASNTQRLLYAIIDDDGRPTTPWGGLWVSIDAATGWSHVNLCAAGTNNIAINNIASVTFINVSSTSAQPYVSTACGIWTTTDPALGEGTWQQLNSSGENTPPPGSIVVGGGLETLFACNGTQVFRATSVAGVSANWTVAPALAGPCFHMTAAPNGDAASTTAIVIYGTPTNQEVATVNFFAVSPATITNLNYSARPNQVPMCNSAASCAGGSGQSFVAAPPITSVSGSSGPGFSYDVYAADGCAWYAYNPSPPAGSKSWSMLAYGGTECNSGTTTLHVDTWAMAFPSWYDTGKGLCGAYAATDGGVFFAGYQQLSGPIIGGCTSNWITVQHKLHVLYSDAIYGITAGSKVFAPSGATYALYLPTQDNDTFVTKFGWQSWSSFPDGLGDSNMVLVDPALPNQVIATRNLNYVAFTNPLGPSAIQVMNERVPPTAPYVPPVPGRPAEFDWGTNLAETADFTQVMTFDTGSHPPPPAPTSADYLAVVNQQPSCAAGFNDRVWRNQTTSPGGWHDIDVSPSAAFPACAIGKIQAAGTHTKPTIYVLTAITESALGNKINYTKPGLSGGQIYKGIVSSTAPHKIQSWTPATGTGKHSLGIAYDFFVNPYNPAELYAVTSTGIRKSVTSGTAWDPDDALTDIATNHGEYRLSDSVSGGTVVAGCNFFRASGPFSQGCGLSGMAFDAFKSKIRVAAVFYGGIAFSRDSGRDWIALDITDNNHLSCLPAKGPPCLLVSDNLTQIVASVFFDGETHGPPSKKKPPIPVPDQVIYAGLRGNSIRAILGPFENLTSLNFTHKPVGSPKNVSVVVLNPGLEQTIPLRACTDSSGKPAFCGSLLFDWQTVPSVSSKRVIKYQYTDEGGAGTRLYPLTTADTDSGVAHVSN
jgi:hypothetical protein